LPGGGERTWVLSISFIFSFFTTLPLSHSGSPFDDIFGFCEKQQILCRKLAKIEENFDPGRNKVRVRAS
jgi:hypothetical protein